MGFIIGFIFVVASVAVFFGTTKARKASANEAGKKVPVIACGIGFLLGVLFIGMSCLYTQDVGETSVKIDWGGAVTGSETEPGWKTKAPWEHVVFYSVRNNLINEYGSASYSYEEGNATGPAVSLNDKTGATAAIDVQVIYSLDPNSAIAVYSDYGDQQTFTANYISNDVRSAVRIEAAKFDTITLLTDKGALTKAMEANLKDRWAEIGLIVESINIQDIRYDESITRAYAEAQAAEVQRQKAENQQKTAEVEAKTKVIQAQGEAEANRVLAESLSPEVLTQKWIDKMGELGSKGNLVVVPEGSTPFVNVQKSQ